MELFLAKLPVNIKSIILCEYLHLFRIVPRFFLFILYVFIFDLYIILRFFLNII